MVNDQSNKSDDPQDSPEKTDWEKTDALVARSSQSVSNPRFSQRFHCRITTTVLLTGWVCFFLTSNIILGTSVRLVNLVEMVYLADRIFVGKCLSSEEIVDPVLQLPVTEHRFVVQQGIKGVDVGAEILVRQLSQISGTTRHRKGDRLLIFLHGDSRVGLTSPVGMGQGVFQLAKGVQGQWTVTNALRNQNLVFNLTGQLTVALGLDAVDLEHLQEDRIDLEVISTILGKINASLGSASPR